MRRAADLHIHSCLSPCGDLSMSPAFVARRAAALGLSLAALTDHNSALNAPAFAVSCVKEGVVPVFGIEVTTREEIHVLALFETPEQALRLGDILDSLLPPLANDPERLGDQVYVDENDVILGEVGKYLVNAVDLSLEETGERILALDGLFIPAHIDRPIFSLTSQLGFVPDGQYSALEFIEKPGLVNTGGRPVVANSDAHYPEAIGLRRTLFDADEPSFRAYRRALAENRVTPIFGSDRCR